MKAVKCPICGNKYIDHDGLYSHIERMHSDLLPIGIGPDQYYYDETHNHKKSHCVVCGRETPWNSRTHKYHRLCGRKECDLKIREEFHKRMMRTHGTDNLAKDPDHQRKMLQHRKISGIYEWSDGSGKIAYVGSYEKDFLKVCDLMLDLKPTDVVPSPFTYKYIYHGKEHFYIPDFYIPDILLEVEIKDGGDNPNMHHKIQAIDKAKERLKDKVMIKQRNHHYIKITNKNYGPFIKLVNKLVANDLTKQEKVNKIKVIGK